jgi:hypothetical protein
MVRVGNNFISPDVTPRSATESASPVAKAAVEPHISDRVELSHSAEPVPEDRAGRIAALKTALASPDYLPSSLPVSRKLVTGALSRTD